MNPPFPLAWLAVIAAVVTGSVGHKKKECGKTVVPENLTTGLSSLGHSCKVKETPPTSNVSYVMQTTWYGKGVS